MSDHQQPRFFAVRNFEKFQHYTDRRPPWIKLYRDLWDDPRFFDLSPTDRYVLISIFVLASQHENKVPMNEKWLRAQLIINGPIPLKRLVDTGWIQFLEQDASNPLAASNVLASRYPSRARGETETETETEVQRQNTDTDKTPIPEPRTAYGEFLSVFLTDEEHGKLESRMNGNLPGLIDELDRYSQTHPKDFKKYRSHYAVLKTWAVRKGLMGGGVPQQTEKESYGQRVARKNRETAERLNQRFLGTNGDTLGAGDIGGSNPALLSRPK